MTGNILWVRWETILTAAIVYTLVGIFHYIYRDRFLLISHDPELAYQQGLNVRLWDFLFYVSFGIVITHSVSTAGVLLVFVFLVVPAIATIMITEKLWLQLVLGWSMGTFVSMLGLFLSYAWDLPSGPTVVATYGSVLLVTTLGLYLIRASRKMIALGNLTFGLAVFLLAVLVFWLMGKGFQSLEQHAEDTAHDHELHAHLHEEDTAVGMILSDLQLREILTGSLKTDSLLVIYSKVQNPFQRFEIAHRIFDLDQKLGSQKLIDFLDFCQVPFLRQKALDILVSLSSDNFGYDAMKMQELNKSALEKWHEWWEGKYSGK